MKVQAHYPNSEMFELFEGETMNGIKLKIKSELSDPDEFKYSELDENDNQLDESIIFSQLR